MTTTIELPQVSSVIKSKIKAILDDGFTPEQGRKISEAKVEAFSKYGDDTTADDLHEAVSEVLCDVVFSDEEYEKYNSDIEEFCEHSSWETIIQKGMWETPNYVDDTVDQLLAKINALSAEDRKSLLDRLN